MAPRSVEEISIENAVRQLCRQITKMTGIDVSLHYGGQANEAENSNLSTIYRLAQETLNNTIKHAVASRAQVAIIQTKNL